MNNVIRLSPRHANLVYGFLIANSKKGIVAHHRTGVDILGVGEVLNYFLGASWSITLGRFEDEVLSQLLISMVQEESTVVRFIYGKYSPDTVKLLDSFYLVCSSDPWRTTYDFVIPQDDLDSFKESWSGCKMSSLVTEQSFTWCPAFKRSTDLRIRDLVLGKNMPYRELTVMSIKIDLPLTL